MRFVFALVAALLAGACATAPPESPAQARINAATADRVYAALNANPVFYFRDVDVSVDGGVAYLSGYVWTTDALYQAQNIARGVPGVTRVVDDMKLEREGLRGGGDGGGAQ
jgi:osmotically-inducible protein OsmY